MEAIGGERFKKRSWLTLYESLHRMSAEKMLIKSGHLEDISDFNVDSCKKSDFKDSTVLVRWKAYLSNSLRSSVKARK